MKFYKYQGTGNDFVMIDNRNLNHSLNAEHIAQLCNRRFGIGADGLILLQKHADYDFEMVYFNADGQPSSMCGNGGRCTVRFAHDLGVIGTHTHFLAVDGEHHAEVFPDKIALKMGKVSPIKAYEKDDFLNTGSPHYIKYVENVAQYAVFEEGKKLRYSDYWAKKGGTNVNFVQLLPDKSLFVRTYERGVEDETYSCGTGVTAAALSAHQRLNLASPLSIQTKGGNLSIQFDKAFDDVWLIGPAKRVFVGEIHQQTF